MLDLQAEQHHHGQACPELYEAVAQLKRRHDLHPCAVQPRDGLALRRDSERELVQDLVKRYGDVTLEQKKPLPALLNSLAQLELVAGDLRDSQENFQEVARRVSDPLSQAVAHHNVYRVALERRDWTEALAALRRAVALDAETFEPFPLARFEPERILGCGGFGVSFLCRQLDKGRPVVVKALRADSAEREPATLFRDLNALQDLDNPVLVRIHECAFAGGDASRPYLACEKVEGQTLAEFVAERGPLTPDDWLSLSWPLARALQAMHGRGILHRSLRSASVMIVSGEREPAPGDASAPQEAASGVALEPQVSVAHGASTQLRSQRVKLMDVGLSLKRTLIHSASSNPDARTQTALGRSVARSLAYAPLELIGRPKGHVWVGPHSDIFSFGKLCALALTGRPDPDPEELEPVPSEWRQLIADCTAWTIAQRPANFGIVLDRLSQLPGAAERVRAIEHDLHEITIAEHTAALEVDPNQAAILVRRGSAYARQGDFVRAIADYSRALQLTPEDASLYRRRALVHARNRALDQAIADCTEALRLEPRNVEALANRGLAYAQKREHQRAIADFTEALRHKPRDATLLFNRGNAYADNNQFALALADFTETIRLEPRNLWAYRNRGRIHSILCNHARAIADFSRILQWDARNTDALSERADSYCALEQYDNALADASRALELEPNSHDLLTSRAFIYLEAGDSDKALTDYSAAIALDAGCSFALLRRGEVFMQRGEFDKALADLDEVIRLEPQSEDGWRLRGQLHARRGAYEEALRDYSQAIELNPRRRSLWRDRAALHAERGELQQALEDYNAALRPPLTLDDAYAKRGDVYRRLGKHKAALADYKRALRSDPDDVQTLHHRAETYVRLRRFDRAVADYTAILRLDPADVLAHINRGHIHAERGDSDSALADYTEALRLQPNEATIHHHLGRVHALRGDWAKAIEDNLEALRLNSEDARTWNNLAWLWATSPVTEQRDPPRALEHARRACELTQEQDAVTLDTLAAAHAANGQFDEAIHWQKRAIELAGEAGPDEYRARLQLYEAGCAYTVGDVTDP